MNLERTKFATVTSVGLRVFGQGMLALTSFLVSFSAAHSLGAQHLAIFFVAWTLESMWIAALRTIFVPAFLASQSRPRLLALTVLHIAAVLPITVAVICVGLFGGLDLSAVVLLALTPVCLGAFEVTRTYLSVGLNSRMSSADALMLFLSGAVFIFSFYLVKLDPLHSALVGVVVGASSMAGLYGWRSAVSNDVTNYVSLRKWGKDRSSLLRIGLLEWGIFFIISMAGVSLLGGLGGAEVLSGVRLAETLLAPLSIAGAAIPLVLAPYMSVMSRRNQNWPTVARMITWGFAFAASVWIAIILVVPLTWLEILVGEHGRLAREGLAGLAAGAIVSFFSATASLILKARGLLNQVRLVRWIQLSVSIPLIALGAMWESIFLAGLGMASHQVIACALLILVERKARA